MIEKDRIVPFVRLGERIKSLIQDEDSQIFQACENENNWFTKENVIFALTGLLNYLKEESLSKWLNKYNIKNKMSKRVGVVMAGNIPMVGFHDLLTVLLSGHHIMVKMSSQDSVLIKYVIDTLIDIDPSFRDKISIVDRLNEADAFIGTGSDNSARYFKYYFGSKPHIIRKNRTAVAVLTGKETAEDIKTLGWDIFRYYGLGCRNVSKLLVPEDYDFQFFLDSLAEYDFIGDHHKYRNNYDYNKSIYLVNGEPHLDSGFLLLKESSDIVSPISVLFYEKYVDSGQLSVYLRENKEKIQCVVGDGYIPFGRAQQPGVEDYADGVDTMEFLCQL
ncbi:MAG: acyl-CoA reductase [Cyclobacteriaceae bacterium]